MTVTCVYVRVKAEAVSKFIEATTENHLESVKEKGNFRFDLIQQADDPEQFMIYEVYETEEDAAAHKKTQHYMKWRDAVSDMMAEPRKGIKYNLIQPRW
jgi:(4S)-4-hydroxy-5-phosphonooxypentane-2,3-dione isomerase